MKPLLLILLIIPVGVSGQISKKDSIWLPMTQLLGTWEGQGGGEPGIGRYDRTYAFIFGGQFIEVRNKSVYPPTDQYPKGEIHQDVGYISYDKGRRKFVLRQFHVEGFVNQYVLDSLSADGRAFVFVSEAIENIPSGWRARESYQVVSKDEIIETFELAGPGEPFKLYTRVKLERAK